MIFIYIEIEVEKEEAKGIIAAENNGEDSLRALAFASVKIAKLKREEVTDRKTSDRKPLFENYQKKIGLARGDRKNEGID